MSVEKALISDLLRVQEVEGTELMYEVHGGKLHAVHLNDEGDVIAEYVVAVTLEEV